jgi:tetratricopeptide (TPR) repeat protein
LGYRGWVSLKASTRFALAVLALVLVPLPGPSETADYREAYESYVAALQEKDLEKALIYARKSHDLAAAELGLRHARTGVLAYNLGAVRYNLDRYRDALPALQEAVATYAKNYGPESKKNVLALRKLGLTHMELENWSEAERYSVQAIAILEAERGRTDPAITDILLDLTEIARNLQHAKRMRSYAMRALYNLRQGDDPDALGVGHVYVSLATAEMLLGNASATNKSLDRALEIYEIHLTLEDPQLRALYTFAADAFERTGRSSAARKYRRRLKENEG